MLVTHTYMNEDPSHHQTQLTCWFHIGPLVGNKSKIKSKINQTKKIWTRKRRRNRKDVKGWFVPVFN